MDIRVFFKEGKLIFKRNVYTSFAVDIKNKYSTSFFLISRNENLTFVLGQKAYLEKYYVWDDGIQGNTVTDKFSIIQMT